VPDNTKVAVIKACLYEPPYAEMAAHYDTAILPARPRDKAKVEVAVLIIERWLLGRLRHRRFYSLAELNAALGELLRQLNDERLIRRLGVTRRALFEELDRPNLNSLPAQPYCYRRCNSDPGRRLKSDLASRLVLSQSERAEWLVESGCGAVVLGRPCRLPPLSSGGALVGRP
jgi:hypothetical protein